MADTKISALTDLGAEPASDDKLVVVDTSATLTKRVDWSVIKALFTTHALATAANDFIVASGAGVFVKKTLAETLTILGKAAASGLASLDGSSKVVQDPANATATPTASKIPIADGSGKLDGWVSLSSYVANSLFDAHTVLAATSDNTPAALTVGEQTVVGRITGGNIAALTVAQLAALALSAALPENTAVILDAALSADGKYSGIVEAGTAGAALAFGDLVYLAVADSRWELADADAEATAFGKLGICVLAAAGDGSATTILLYGKVRADAVFPALTVGAPVFVGTTAGDVQTTAPSGAADIIRIVGYGNTADELHFCPSNDFFEHA